MHKYAVVAVPLILLLSLSNSNEYKYKIYYFPMFVHADGIDEKIIESRFDLTSVCQAAAPKIIRILNESKEPSKGLQPYMLRLKISDGRNVYLVDLAGNVQVGSRRTRISQDDKKRIRQLLFDELPWDYKDTLN